MNAILRRSRDTNDKMVNLVVMSTMEDGGSIAYEDENLYVTVDYPMTINNLIELSFQVAEDVECCLEQLLGYTGDISFMSVLRLEEDKE